MRVISINKYLSDMPDLHDSEKLSQCLKVDLCTRAIILTLIDHFSDFQENRLIAPVRELSVKLMIPCLHVIPLKTLTGTILGSGKLYWMYKYNVLLILKTMLVKGRRIYNANKSSPEAQQIMATLTELKENQKVLDNVWKCLKSEDEVKILACECIEELMEAFIKVDDTEPEEDLLAITEHDSVQMWEFQGSNYSTLLEEVLNESDDIECTAISVFNLLQKICKHKEYDRRRFIDTTVTLPFAFHKMLQVRISFTQFLKIVLDQEVKHRKAVEKLMQEQKKNGDNAEQKQIPFRFFTLETIQKLFLIALQAWVLEKDLIVDNWLKILKKLCYLSSGNMELIGLYMQILNQRFFFWLKTKVFDNFDTFMFLANENFEELKSYYEITKKPVTESEIQYDYLMREWNGAKCLATIVYNISWKEMTQYVSEYLICNSSFMTPPYDFLQTIHLLYYYHLMRIQNCEETIDGQKPLYVFQQSVLELFTVLKTITPEVYPLWFSPSCNNFLKKFEAYGFMLANDDVPKEHLQTYTITANYISQIINQRAPNINKSMFDSVEELYTKSKSHFIDKENFKNWFDKISEIREDVLKIEIESATYATVLKTIIASTLIEAYSAYRESYEKDSLSLMIRPLLSTVKNENIEKLYQTMSSQALVKLIESDSIALTTKTKIVKWIIGYIKTDFDCKKVLSSYKTGRKYKFYTEEIEKVIASSWQPGNLVGYLPLAENIDSFSIVIESKIPAFMGVWAFFHSYAEVFGSEKILVANDSMVLKAIQNQFAALSIENKDILLYTPDNTFYDLVIMLKTLVLVWKDIDKNLKIEKVNLIFEPLIDILVKILDSEPERALIPQKTLDEKLTPSSVHISNAPFLRILSKLLGDILSKNLVDRKVILEFIFKIIEVDQSDLVFKDLGREAIEISLQMAENDETIDFFKYLPCFIIPVLKNSSKDPRFSLLMAKLFKLLPLNKAGVFDQKSNSKDEIANYEEYEQGFEFLKVLSNKRSSNKEKILKYLQSKIKLREYQEHGISWIVSLTDFGFSCALCDDMGLGKTFQALAAIAIKISELKSLSSTSNSSKTGISKTPKNLSDDGFRISLVVWPSTLVHNWKNEIRKFFKEDDLKGEVFEEVFEYFDYRRLKKNMKKTDILIISYEKVRAHYEFFRQFNFLYIILDEAHLIKNAKSLTTQAIKTLTAQRKLILTGTPLQNRVTELWSIFDFLMPGFLEDESTFNKKYTKYLSTNLRKLGESEKETEQFLKSIKNLRERISPFILRRTKENVMKELPPKIIQDYKCPLSDFQAYLHEILDKIFPYTEGMKSIDVKAKDSTKNRNAIENLLAHRRLCNHPEFILDDKKTME